MNVLLIILFSISSVVLSAQKIQNTTLTSTYTNIKKDNIHLMYSVGEAAPVTELVIGANKLTQGYFQYQLKNVTQIIDDKGEINLAAFPNPFTDEIKLDLMNAGYGRVEFRIENILGQVLYLNTINRVLGQSDLQTIQLKNVASGTYLLSIQFLDKVNQKYTIKLIKN